MLRIIVQVVPGGFGKPQEVARAQLGNISALADLPDYRVAVREGANPLAGRPAWEAQGQICGHDRNQTVWRLVEPAAKFAADEAEKS